MRWPGRPLTVEAISGGATTSGPSGLLFFLMSFAMVSVSVLLCLPAPAEVRHACSWLPGSSLHEPPLELRPHRLHQGAGAAAADDRDGNAWRNGHGDCLLKGVLGPQYVFQY